MEGSPVTLKVLDKPQQFYVDLLTEWLTVPTLTIGEKSIIIQLLNGAHQSLETFDTMRGTLATNNGFLFNNMVSAVNKARAHGIGRHA